jgi:hypothetical protein
MPLQFSILNVSAQFIMDVAKVVASSPYPLSKEDLLRSFNRSQTYVLRALSQCVQLGLLCYKDNKYSTHALHEDLLKRSEKNQLYLSLRQALQRFPPFLLYVDFISKKYSPEDSARMIRGIFRIQSSEKIIDSNFRNWGFFSQLIQKDNKNSLIIPEAEEGLPTNYVECLMKALKANLAAKIFLIETMSPSAYAYLTEKEIDIDELANALINYETDSKTSANKACQSFEHFLFKLGKDVGADVGNLNGLSQYADAIRGTKNMLKNQMHICHGLGGIRNMAHHDPDKETGKEWFFTPQGAIVTTLLVPATIRSLYVYWKQQKQEF